MGGSTGLHFFRPRLSVALRWLAHPHRNWWTDERNTLGDIMSEKISQLTSGNPAQGSDQIPINRGGSNFSITAASIAALAGGGGGGILGLWPGNWLGINIAGSVNGAALLDGSAFGMSP